MVNEVGIVLDDIKLHVDQSLDRSNILDLIEITERQGNSTRPGPRRSPDAVNIGLRIMGDIVIDDVGNLVHIDPA